MKFYKELTYVKVDLSNNFMEYHVRKALSADAKAIAMVHVQSWKETYKDIVNDEYLKSLNEVKKTEMWESLLADKSDSIILVVENEKLEIVGFVSGGQARENNSRFKGELYAIYILKKYQRKGLGVLLIENLCSNLCENGIKNMYVCVLQDNNAKNFYLKCGAKLFHSAETEIGDQSLMEEIYGWENFDDFSLGGKECIC